MPASSLARAALALAVAALPASCGEPTAPDRSAPFSGRLDGRPFAAAADGFLVRGNAGADTLYIHSGPTRDVGEYEVGVSLTVASFAGPGRYRLGAYQAYVFETVGGDVVYSTYAAAGPAAGTVVVTSYDAASGAIAGTVEFTAALDPARTTGSFGASVRLTAGRFRATVRAAP